MAKAKLQLVGLEKLSRARPVAKSKQIWEAALARYDELSTLQIKVSDIWHLRLK